MSAFYVVMGLNALLNLIFDGFSLFWAFALVLSPFGGVLTFLTSRRETRITSSALMIWAGTIRPRSIPLEQITRLYRRTSYSPVRIDLTTGQTIELPGVRAEDFDDVRAEFDRVRGRLIPPPSVTP